MIIHNVKSLILFAPDQEIMDSIRQIAEHHMDKIHYDIEFLDVIQTGRKTWVEIYLTSHNRIINTKILLQLRNDIRAEQQDKYLTRYTLNCSQVCQTNRLAQKLKLPIPEATARTTYCLLCQRLLGVLQLQHSGFCRQRTIVIALPLFRFW